MDPLPDAAPATGARARNRRAIETQILAVARRHLAETGAASLSLRAIARDMGLTPSALYRYVENRDELLTRLIIAAFDAAAKQVEEAESRVAGDDLPGRWRAIAHALRSWALAHPHEYALVYGSPVPDYHAPGELTTPSGTRVIARLMALYADAAAAGAHPRPAALAPDARDVVVRALLEDAAPPDTPADPDLVLAGATAWMLLLGTISQEVFGHAGDLGPAAEPLFDASIAHAWAIVTGEG
ncbi:hypothetical protein BJH93_03075 [Kocuria polaris]|nr:hypothetical protein [Kocuria polaris]